MCFGGELKRYTHPSITHFREATGMRNALPNHRFPVSLRSLFPRSSFVGCADIYVNDVTEDSRDCQPGFTFAAIPGTRQQGADFAAEAVRFGATSLLVQKPIPEAQVSQCVVPNVRKAYAELCQRLHGNPSRLLSLVGVTGTNGKTTTAWLVRSILQAAGQRCGHLGTIEYHDGQQSRSAPLTTPDSRTLAIWLERMVRAGTTAATLELSSHALDQNRVAGTELHAAIVTNLTQDHFDYHGGFAAYKSSKARIFELVRQHGTVVLNADDPEVAAMAQTIDPEHIITTYGLDRDADVTANIVHESLAGTRFELRLLNERISVETSLVGRHNLSNCLAAAAAARQLGASAKEIAAGIETLTNIPGRLERVDAGRPFHVFVDYAHTDDALGRCVKSLRRLTPGRVICVFGAGGDRDKTKRPLLGAAAAQADVAIITSDNPRSEDPLAIIEDILGGFQQPAPQPLIEPDREKAIREAIDIAEPGDCVLIAGKGHEAYQMIGQKRLRFDDGEVAHRILHNHIEISKVGPERLPV